MVVAESGIHGRLSNRNAPECRHLEFPDRRKPHEGGRSGTVSQSAAWRRPMSGKDSSNPHPAPQVKICGLTRVDEAVACAELGADAIGLVFYPPSPRFITDKTAREICLNLPQTVWPVGVFVNEPLASITAKIETCGLKAVQLHGAEPPDLVDVLTGRGILVIKSLFLKKSPALTEAAGYRAIGIPHRKRRRTLAGGQCRGVELGSGHETAGQSAPYSCRRPRSRKCGRSHREGLPGCRRCQFGSRSRTGTKRPDESQKFS